jgi:1-acyl-sn-glycerol-3-phosphate acyltransferase
MVDSNTAVTFSLERALVEPIVHFAGDHPAETLQALRAKLERLLRAEPPEAVQRLVTRLATTGDEFRYYPPDPLAIAIHGVIAEIAMTADSSLVHAERLADVRGRSVVFLPNHLSYSDANLFEVLLERAGYRDVAERLTVIAGPKVYSDPMRRFSSLCFGTIKTPQSTARSSAEAVMTTREVALLAKETIAIAHERQGAGDALLVFVEGTRSRDRAMQRTLPAIVRYFEDPATLLVPIGIAGSERFIPVGEDRIHPTCVTCRVGRPVEAGKVAEQCDGNRRLIMDVIGTAIARQLPPEYRGVYADSPSGDGADELAEARDIGRRLFPD